MNQFKKDRIIIKTDILFYTAEIFEHDRSSQYVSMCCGNCNNKVFTEFYADAIPENVVKKVNFKPDLVVNYEAHQNRLKFTVCDNCSEIYISDNFVGILIEDEDDKISYSYKINNELISLSNKLYNEIKLYFWQTQKEPIEIIIDERYHDEVNKYLDDKLLDEFSNVYKKYLAILNRRGNK